MRGPKHTARNILQVILPAAYELQRALDEDRLDEDVYARVLADLQNACDKIGAECARLRGGGGATP